MNVDGDLKCIANMVDRVHKESGFALAFLIEAGIIDEDENFTPPYRNPPGIDFKRLRCCKCGNVETSVKFTSLVGICNSGYNEKMSLFGGLKLTCNFCNYVWYENTLDSEE